MASDDRSVALVVASRGATVKASFRTPAVLALVLAALVFVMMAVGSVTSKLAAMDSTRRSPPSIRRGTVPLPPLESSSFPDDSGKSAAMMAYPGRKNRKQKPIPHRQMSPWPHGR